MAVSSTSLSSNNDLPAPEVMAQEVVEDLTIAVAEVRGRGVERFTRTWGLDMSTNARGTAAVALEWAGEHANVASVHSPLDAEDVVALIAEESQWQWAVDVPFGWPSPYVDFLKLRRHHPLTDSDLELIEDRRTWRTSTLAQRATDVFLTSHPQIKARPLPAAFQMLGATAAMWALIEADLAERGVAVDRSGMTGTVCETYPRAALKAWGWTKQGKPTLDDLRGLFPLLRVGRDLEGSFASHDVCDALVCAVVARARHLGRTLCPPDLDLDLAREEGWIHVSLAKPNQLVGASS
jgi:hypothetical protein